MPETLYSPATAYEIVRWKGTRQSLVDLSAFAGQNLSANPDGTVTVMLGGVDDTDPEVETLKLGWALFRTEKIALGAMSGKMVESLDDQAAA